LVGLLLIGLLNRPDSAWLAYLYDQPLPAPWIAQTLRSLPVATLAAWYVLRSIDEAVLEAAAMDGAGPVARFWRIAVPARLPGLAAAWLAAFAVAVGELAATIVVQPPGVTTVSCRVFELLHAGVEDYVAGICLVLAAGFAGLGLIVAWLFHCVRRQ
jgi:ABC-type spermidine/putrescine transport system permease subunit II